MRPDATEILNGIKQIMFNILLPELQSEQARAQVMYSSLLIDHVIARWEIEGPLLLEERAELRDLMTKALTVVNDARIREGLDASTKESGGPRTLATDNERLRSLVPILASELPADNESAREVDAAIRAYIRNQHQRDQALVAVGGINW